jgi:hypothetical protein
VAVSPSPVLVSDRSSPNYRLWGTDGGSIPAHHISGIHRSAGQLSFVLTDDEGLQVVVVSP